MSQKITWHAHFNCDCRFLYRGLDGSIHTWFVAKVTKQLLLREYLRWEWHSNIMQLVWPRAAGIPESLQKFMFNLSYESIFFEQPYSFPSVTFLLSQKKLFKAIMERGTPSNFTELFNKYTRYCKNVHHAQISYHFNVHVNTGAKTILKRTILFC